MLCSEVNQAGGSIAPLAPLDSSAACGPLDIPPSPPLTTVGQGAPRFESYEEADNSTEGGTIEEMSLPQSADSLYQRSGADSQKSTEGDEEDTEEQNGSRNSDADTPESEFHECEDDEAETEQVDSNATTEQQQQHQQQQPAREAPGLRPPLQQQQWHYTPPEYSVAGARLLPGDVPWDQQCSLDMWLQDRSRQWETYCQEQRKRSLLTGTADGLVLVSSLVSEAWRLERHHVLRRFRDRPAEVWPPCRSPRTAASGAENAREAEMHRQLALVDSKWKRVGANALRDVRADTQPFDTVRRLANMFIFLEGKQLDRYMPDNPHLHARIAAQRQVIDAISSQKGKLFLEQGAFGADR
eukprot:TRINITY_DN8406_c0_g1_i2.p1 TRINITY_DN8406_c0_g1~~TRINITY_DN8406_c0_g1_i2.p1  ORF type:complete len:355 (+),score=61.33 TRINITY_DN8406_c0_g1_i2:874-1938(+)